MNAIWIGAALFLLLTVAAGMVRVLMGPRPGDRMLAAQLFGTAGVAMLLLLAWGLEMPALVDVALVFALLSAVATVAFVRQRGLPREGGEEP
ncbi:multiple resistance and pH regulation protein F [Ectothiorhodospira haloalkaliphila]|uniref:Multiple resistance and pH regulation protein F n=1 Tax=Ectothiorhodospira haloalkaliphila TaxID=421628 RepID=W8KLF3_9GAMM|nr:MULTISPECIES: monovalent cation/H+ antiporter complex subunit F [Ectothiorhodospira]AHK79998.1 multiple resistance and pH regulation protein F [Ectothiorhodospira haloalkaliphila]MCG5493644.1 monovalent cation/H+ antiporter complex subunit F [Ectothiorhodospira variabilis]MCG5496990.1 monovalent cation/H+ antiporter complex subunit F [Ectothiorhodospira variabilis]MCG5502973.1 monovalent cation/H+ antiporter complex subunit F [Ectothiorhodospira variabilis]MCG5506239.1 monovalent cation/H+ 